MGLDMALDNEFKIENESLTSIVESIITGVCIFALTDARKLVPVYLNEGLYRMLGYSHKELDRMLRDIRLSIIPDDIPIFEEGIDEILKDNGAVDFEFRTVTGSGAIRWLQVRGNLYGKMDGYPLMAGIVIDCTERRSIQEELALQQERLNILFESVKEHYFDYNSRTDILEIQIDNSVFKRKKTIIKNLFTDYSFPTVYPDDLENLKNRLESARKSQLTDTVDFRCNSFDDNHEYLWYRATISSVRGADGYVSRIVGRIVNIDSEKKKEMELRLKADRDALTGLYNKGTAITLITDAVGDCIFNKQKAAMIMIDLDHFKSVNDTFGHAAGDMILEEAGGKLKDAFKGRDIVGRMGGDEFMVFMTDIKDPRDAVGICSKLNQTLTRPISNSNGEVTVTASIGIAYIDGEKDSFSYEELFERADKALYITKENGRNGRTLYED